MRKRIIGAMCFALPLFVSTKVSTAATLTFDWVYKLAIQITSGVEPIHPTLV